MKTIRILIAASDEMHDESLKFSELIANLNEVLEPRGIELERVKWNPETEGSLDEFKASLMDCEMCLTLYWKSLVANSDVELDTAYQELKDGNNPRKLYVFFKEPSEGIAGALRDFKASFENKYGHFFCRFENADTMNLHFILQFEAYNNQMNSDLVKVTDGKVLVGDKEMVNLDNVPFAAMNKEYQRLQKELLALEEEIAGISVRYAANTKDKELLKQMSSLGSKREQLSEEFEKYQRHLYDIALTFAKQSGEHYSERMRKARELFEVGKVIEADQILNMEDMKREKKAELALRMQNLQNLETMIEEFCLKADTVMANPSLSIPDRFTVASDAYDDAVSIAKDISYDKAKLAKIFCDYASLLARFSKKETAVNFYQMAVEIYYVLCSSNSETYQPQLASTLNNLGILQSDLYQYEDAEESYTESLKFSRELALSNPEIYRRCVADTLSNLGVMLSNQDRLSEAENKLNEAFVIYRDLVSDINFDVNILDVVTTLSNIGNLKYDFGRYEEAEKFYREGLDMIRYRLLSNPKDIDYKMAMAAMFQNLGSLQGNLCQYDDALKSLDEALNIFRELAFFVPKDFRPSVAIILYDKGLLQAEHCLHMDAKSSFDETLTLFRDLATDSSELYRRWEALTLTKLGNLQEDLENIDEAKRYWREALKIFRELEEKNPGEYSDRIEFLEAWTKEE